MKTILIDRAATEYKVSKPTIRKYLCQYRELGLPGHRLELLPKCRSAIERYSESYEENWARRLIWAYNALSCERGGTAFFWSDMRRISGVKKKNADRVDTFMGYASFERIKSSISRYIDFHREKNIKPPIDYSILIAEQ